VFKIIVTIGSIRQEINEFDDIDEAREAAIEYQILAGEDFEILVESGADVMPFFSERASDRRNALERQKKD
jgi:hypothetical protein